MRKPWDLKSRGWFFTLRNIARATDERTIISAVIPRSAGCEHTPYVESIEGAISAAILVATFNSIVFDYCSRQKVGGTQVSYFILYQLPVPALANFKQPCRWLANLSFQSWLLPRVLELVYTAIDVRAFAEELGFAGNPFVWDDARRAVIRAELDAAFFHLYGISEADANYILDTFPIVKAKDEERFGTYRTKEMILRFYRQMAAGEFTSELIPPPGVTGSKPKVDLTRMSMVVVLLTQAAKLAGRPATRDDLTLGLALVFNDAARKAVLGKPLSEDEKLQLDELPEYVVGLDRLLFHQAAQGLIREHEGLYLPGPAAPPTNQAPASDVALVQEVVMAVRAMNPTEKSSWAAKVHAKHPLPR